MNDSPPNVAEFTVSELAAALKRTVEDAYGYVRVRGEISGFRGRHASGHCYFALKDEGAKIEAVIWKSALARMRIKPEEGLEVIATGRLSTYPTKSTYQIIVEALEPAGPRARTVVGSAARGAVIRDILHRLADRFPRPVLLWPVRVQGEGSAAEIAAAIEG